LLEHEAHWLAIGRTACHGMGTSRVVAPCPRRPALI
jgi:hypothetical protein